MIINCKETIYIENNYKKTEWWVHAFVPAPTSKYNVYWIYD